MPILNLKEVMDVFCPMPRSSERCPDGATSAWWISGESLSP